MNNIFTLKHLKRKIRHSQKEQNKVSTNGVISFLQGVSTFTPDPFPIANDARMIAPYWADIDTTRGGTVWYRETTDAVLLDRATKEVTNNYPEFFRFKASWVFIATWDRVAFYGCAGVGCSKTNTFQAVLITNGQHSFTIYNYEDIQWTTGTASGGKSTTGIGGTPAQVGFNAGDGIVSLTVNASRSPDIVNVDKHSNVDIPGKFAFRIDASDISDGGCNTEGNLTIAPRYGPMLGGQYLIISGPCIEQNATIKVSFSGSPQKECERKSEFAFACITPLFSHTGDTPVKVETKNQEGESRIFQGLYTVLNLADCKHQVHRHDASDWFSGRQQISWDPDVAELFVAKFNERLVLKWYNPKNGIESLKNTGTTKYNLPDPKNNYAMAIRVTAAPQRENQSPKGIWSDVFPLAVQQDKANEFCKNWSISEAQLPSLRRIADDVQPCPCMLDQALLDIVRFQPDPDCNMFNRNRTGNCSHRKDSTHCIRMPQAGPDGIDNLCCYDADKNLIDSRLKEGGCLQRYHYLGGPEVLPYLSNFYFDVLPFLHCCRYSQMEQNDSSDDNNNNGTLCPQYIKHRKISSCVNYEPPRPARTNGDPHITTLDGYSYTFNGVGEFVYLKTTDGTFQSQIRFKQFRKENGDLVDASVCTAFVSRHFSTSGSGVVEVRLNSIRTADLLVNGDIIDFDESTVHRFPGIFVVQMTSNQPNLNTTKKEFIVSFTEIGIAFRAIASPAVLSILPVVGNKTLAGSLRGLLGDFDENPDNDLRTPSEEILLTNSTSERIHYDFGISWRITENISLFSYEPGKSFGDYQLPRFRPTFILPTNLPPEVTEVCGTNRECAFDFTLTDSVEFATETVELLVIFNSSLAASIKTKNCEDLPSVESGVWNATNTLEGSNATLSCFYGYETTVGGHIHCSNGTWGNLSGIKCTPLGSVSKMDDKLEESSRHYYVITICVVVLFVILIIAVVLYRLYKKKRREYALGKLTDLHGDSVYEYKTKDSEL
nr:protein mesh isoform X2 [Crassostrea gigas]